MKIGSLFSGVGGLDLAVETFFDAHTAWFVEFDKAPSKVLAHHWPGVPNYGDVRSVDWKEVEPVDILTGGSPCQDLSGAGRRRGMTDGTRSNLWAQMRESIAILRPSTVIWENVRGAYSAYATSDVESEPGLLGAYGPTRPALRALGRVLGDLSDLGYDTRWHGIRAADADAPHNRFRVFVVAENTDLAVGDQWGQSASGQTESGRTRANIGGRSRTPSTYTNGIDSERRGDNGNLASAPGTGETDGEQRQRDGYAVDDRQPVDWREYARAIGLWESALGRRAPTPTSPDGRDNAHRLNPVFVEWMMGWPEGWVTSPDIGLTRNEQLKACGNGVVPQQALLALDVLMNRKEVAA